MKFNITLVFSMLFLMAGFYKAPVKAMLNDSGEENHEAFANETITISGAGHNLPFNNHPPDAAMHVWYEGEMIGSAMLSDVDGSYSLTVSLTGIYGIANRGFMVRQNPFTDKVEISFAVSGGLHHIRVMDIKGDIILQNDFNLAKGHHTLQLSGLGRGVRLATISNAAGGTETVKLVQTGSSFNPQMEIFQTTENLLKTSVASELALEFFAPGHETYTVTEFAQPNMNINYELLQEQETGTRTKITETNDPLFSEGIPNTNIEYINPENNSLLVQGLTNNQGTFTGSFPHDYWVNWANILDTIFAMPNIKIIGTHPNYEYTEIITPNNAETITLNMNQIQQQTTNVITTVTENDVFGYMIQGAVVQYINPANGSVITQGTTNNQGIHQGNILSQFYVNPVNTNDTLFMIPNVQVNATANNHAPATQITPNQTTTLEFILEQIPENLTANVTGQVTDASTNQGINQATTTALDPDNNVMSTTNTNTQGNYSFTLNYEAWNNPINPEQSFTVPSHFKLKFEKTGYVTHTTAPKNFEENITHNQALNPDNQTYTFSIHPFTATNKQMSEVSTQPFIFYLKTTSDNQIHSFTQNGNNAVQFEITGPYSPEEEIKLWHNNPEGKLDQSIIIEYTDLPWNATNPAQNHPVRNWHPGMPMDSLTTTLGTFANNTYSQDLQALMPEHMLYVDQLGYSIPFSGDTIMKMWANRGATPPNRVKNFKNEAVPHVDILLFTYKVIFGDPWNNSIPVPPDQLATTMTVTENINQYLISATGRVRKPVFYHTISSQADAQEFVDRGWDYTRRIWYHDGSPVNTVILDPQNYRISTSYSKFPVGASQIVRHEEINEARGFGNAPQNTPSSIMTAKLEGSNIVLNDIGITMIVMNSAFDPWTPVLIWNAKTNQFEQDTTDLKQKYNVTSKQISDFEFSQKELVLR